MSIDELNWRERFPRLAEADDPGVRALMASARRVEWPAGQTLFQPGALCSNYLLLLDGAIRVQMLTAGGREVLLYHVLPGSSCILTTSCLFGGNSYPAEGVTDQPSVALIVPNAEFQAALAQSEALRSFVFSDFALRLSRVIGRMEEMVDGDIDRRLARLLIAGADATGTLHRTHRELAVAIGTAREVVSRHIKRFEVQGLVRLGRATVSIVDRERLARMAASA